MFLSLRQASPPVPGSTHPLRSRHGLRRFVQHRALPWWHRRLTRRSSGRRTAAAYLCVRLHELLRTTDNMSVLRQASGARGAAQYSALRTTEVVSIHSGSANRVPELWWLGSQRCTLLALVMARHRVICHRRRLAGRRTSQLLATRLLVGYSGCHWYSVCYQIQPSRARFSAAAAKCNLTAHPSGRLRRRLTPALGTCQFTT